MAKKKAAYELVKKRSGRYAVKGADGKYINGEAKTEILAKEGVIKVLKPKKKEEEAPAE